MDFFYINNDGQEEGPVSRAALRALTGSGMLSMEALCRGQGSGEWQPVGQVIPPAGVEMEAPAFHPVTVPMPPGGKRIPLPAWSSARAGNASAGRLSPALVMSAAALVLSAAAALKVFWPRPSHDFSTPRGALESINRILSRGSWEDYHRLTRDRQAASSSQWTFDTVDVENMALKKTIEIRGSGDPSNNGKIMCIVELKCPDGVTRYDSVVLAKKDKAGDFVLSEFTFVPASRVTPEDRRLKELVDNWEATGGSPE